VFYENNTQEAWIDAKDLGGLDELESMRPKATNQVMELYRIFSMLRRECIDMNRIKSADIETLAKSINYEPDKAIIVIQAADDHFLKLCADKIKRMNQK
jgi:hypothetical protein